MPDISNLTTVTPESSDNQVPEPVPDWPTALKVWNWGWQLHTYVLGLAFFTLALYNIVSLLDLRRRLRLQRHLPAIKVTLIMLGTSRALGLLVDPYESVGRLPRVVARLLFGMTSPCLTTAFSLLLLTLMRITKVHMGPARMRNYKCVALLSLLYFFIVIIINITLAYRNDVKLLLLLCQGIFISWGLVLCFGFIYSGFKMTQFTQETQRVLKELAQYHRIKQASMKNGDRRILALQRISKPKIKITDEENKTYSFGSNSSISNSNSLSYINDAPFDVEDEHLVRTYFQRREYLNMDKRDKWTSVKLNERNTSPTEYTSESDYVTDTPSTVGQPLEAFEMELAGRESLVPKPTYTGASSVFTIENNINYSPTGLDIQGECADLDQANVYENGYITSVEFDDLQTATSQTGCNNNDQPQESGYMADTELNSPKRVKRKGRYRSMENEEIDLDRDGDNSPTHKKYALQTNDGTVSLYRIRQGRILHKVLKVTYFTTLLGFICCVLSLYAMFGVYGVLSPQIHPEPWPWLVFQTCARLAELGMAATMSYVTHNIGRQRQRPAARRRSRRRDENKISSF